MQNFIVAIIVLAATWMVAKRYAPISWKSAIARVAIQMASRLGFEKLAKNIESKQTETPSCTSSCATCGGCSLSSDKTSASEFVVLIDNLKSRKTGAAVGGKPSHF